MATGTITLTNNSDAVAGAGTAFLTDLAAGDFIVANVGGIAYTLPVKAIASDTALTIINKFTGPTMSGLAWFVVTRDQQSSITAALVAQSTEALRVLNYDKSNWQAVFSAAGDITVTMPDGTQFTGPSWQKIVTLLEASDVEAIQPLVDQVRADAQQVAVDKSAAETAKTDAQTSKSSAELAASTASTAKTDAVAAKDTAVSAADTATSQATASEASAVRAEAAAESLDTTNFVRKDEPEAGRDALEVYSRDEVDEAIQNGGSGIPLGFQYHHSNRARLNAGTVVGDGQVVTIAGSFSDLADHAEANEPTTNEALWQSDPGKRGCYVIDRTAGTMRLPDLNGVQPGSYGPVYKTGDGGTIAPGAISQNAAPELTGSAMTTTNAGFVNNNAIVTGVFEIDSNTVLQYSMNGGNNSLARPFLFRASKGNAAYGRDGTTRVKPDSQHGVWVIQYANAAQNSGEIDALAIDTDLQNFKTSQVATNAQLAARIGYALVSTTANPALNSRTVLANPFGNNTPVMCLAEFYHGTLQRWVASISIYSSASSTAYGSAAWYSEGEGIILRVANGGLSGASAASVASQEMTANYVTPSPFRIHVWKVTQ